MFSLIFVYTETAGECLLFFFQGKKCINWMQVEVELKSLHLKIIPASSAVRHSFLQHFWWYKNMACYYECLWYAFLYAVDNKGNIVILHGDTGRGKRTHTNSLFMQSTSYFSSFFWILIIFFSFLKIQPLLSLLALVLVTLFSLRLGIVL